MSRAPKGRETCRWCTHSKFSKEPGKRYGKLDAEQCRMAPEIIGEVKARFERMPCLQQFNGYERWVGSTEDATKCPLFIYQPPEKKA